jgi:hypothetical protein
MGLPSVGHLVRAGTGSLMDHVPDAIDYLTSKERLGRRLNFVESDQIGLLCLSAFHHAAIRAQDGLFTVQQFNVRRKQFLPIDKFWRPQRMYDKRGNPY